MTDIAERSQSMSPGDIVTLFSVDLTIFGIGTPLRFVKRGYRDGSPVLFGGVEYEQIDIEADGFKWDGNGTFPSPKLKISNVSGLLTPFIVNNDELIGATVTVLTTYVAYLDGQPEADPDMYYPPEIYTVEQVTEMNKVYVEWRLSSIIDQADFKIPARVMMRDVCGFKYRVWNGSGFTLFTGECPYNGASYFDENGNPTTAANDKCSHRVVSGCEKRFGVKKVLPFGAFPGISRRHAY